MMSKKRVLLIGPNFYYFLQSMQNAFCQLGWEVYLCTYDNPIHPYNAINKIRYKLSRNKTLLKDISRNKYKQYIESVYSSISPQLTLIVNGDNLLSETVNFFAQSSKVGIWLFDSITRMPDTLPNLQYASSVFCYEKEDIDSIKQKYGIDAYFVPQAVDGSMYYKMSTPKKWDIVFAGDIFHSIKRKLIVPSIVNHYVNNKNIRVWGIYKPWFKNPIKWFTREHKGIYKNCNTSFYQLNVDYNEAKVVLNVHHEQQKNGANPKVFEIAVTGSYQICDANPYIEQLFPNGEIGIYHNEEELFELIDYALSHDMSEQAESARQIVLNNHTFDKRIEQMLELLK